MKPIVLVGLSDFAEILHHYLTTVGEREVAAFSVDRSYMDKESFLGLPVVPLEELSTHYPPEKFEAMVAIGYSNLNKSRQAKYEQLKNLGYSMASFIHPSSIISSTSTTGEHCIIFENNVIQPFSKFGDNIILWTANIIGHHTTIRNNVFISSGVIIAGYADIGENSFFGFCSGVSPDTVMEKFCVLGANEILTGRAKANGLYPARKAKRSKIASDRIALT